MKLNRECLPCLIGTAVEQVYLATDDEETQFEALSEIMNFFGSAFTKDNTPALLGSERSKIIKKVTSNPDPAAELKDRANRLAADLKPYAERMVKEGGTRKGRLVNALKIAAAANSMEFGIAGHEFDPEVFRSEFEKLLEGSCGVDDSQEIASKILSSEDILYLTDNCGEVILDKILMRELYESGVDISIGVRSVPLKEDVTLAEAGKVGLDEFGEVITTGERIGIFREYLSEKLENMLEHTDIIISKGMGNFETISEFEEELEGRLVYLLRAKCKPVARNFGVERGKLVLKFL